METQHTPGPWEAIAGNVHAANGREIIHWRYNTRSGSEEEQAANARLIAAAPDLLEACRAGAIALAESEVPEADLTRIYAAMNAAIAKAEGVCAIGRVTTCQQYPDGCQACYEGE